MPIAWREARVAHVHEWAAGLRTIELDPELSVPFRAGQFVSLALEANGERTARSYSMASAPGEPLAFYLTLVADGALTPRLFALGEGDRLLVNPLAAGNFTLERVPDARVLWLIATGTGLGPYVSMLRTAEPWSRFERLVVVHGVRAPDHLAYREELAGRSAAHEGRLTCVPLVSRDPAASGVLHGRITTALESGALEEAAGASLDPETSQVLLCGNPGMIGEMQALLATRGLQRNRRRAPGHVTVEKYWG